MSYTVKDNEIALIIRPEEPEGTSVAINTGMIVGKAVHSLGPVGGACIDLALTMSAAVLAVEDDEDLLDFLDDIKVQLVKDMFPEQYDKVMQDMDEREEENTIVKNGNVLTLNKWTKTEGNA